MFNTQKSDDWVNTEKYRNSKLHKKKKKLPGIGIDRYRPILRICGMGSEKMVSLHPYLVCMIVCIRDATIPFFTTPIPIRYRKF